MATVGAVVVDVMANTGQFVSGMNKAASATTKLNSDVNRNMKSVSSIMSSAATKVVAFAGAFVGVQAAMAGVRSITNINVSMEKLSGAMESVTGSAKAAAEQMGVLRKFASTTPYELDQSVSAFIRLKNLGLDASEKSLRAYGNTASAMGKNLNDMIEAIADASVFEFERLKEFGVKVRQENDKLLVSFRGNTFNLRKDSQEIINYLQRIGEVEFGDAMAKQMERLPGKLSNLSDSLSSVAMAIGDRGGFNKMLGESADRISALAKSVEQSRAPELIGNVLGGAVNTATTAITRFNDAVGPDVWNRVDNGVTAVNRLAGEMAYLKKETEAVMSLFDNFSVPQSIFDSINNLSKTSGDFIFDPAFTMASTSMDALRSLREGQDINKVLGQTMGEYRNYLSRQAERLGMDDVAAALKVMSAGSNDAAESLIRLRQEAKKVNDIVDLANKSFIDYSNIIPKSILSQDNAVPQVFDDGAAINKYIERSLTPGAIKQRSATVQSILDSINMPEIQKDFMPFDAAAIKKSTAEQKRAFDISISAGEKFNDMIYDLDTSYLKFQNNIVTSSMTGTAARIANIKSETALGVTEMVRRSAEFIKMEGLTSEQQKSIRENTLRNITAFTKSQESEITKILADETRQRSEIIKNAQRYLKDIDVNVKLQSDLMSLPPIKREIILIDADYNQQLTEHNSYLQTLLSEESLNLAAREKLIKDFADRSASIERGAMLKRVEALQNYALQYRQAFEPEMVYRQEIETIQILRTQTDQTGQPFIKADVAKQAQQAAAMRFQQDQISALMRTQEAWAGAKAGVMQYYMEIRNQAEIGNKIILDGLRNVEDAWVNFVTTGKMSFKSLIDSAIADLARLAYRSVMSGILKSILGVENPLEGMAGIFGSVPARAAGGPIASGKPYLIGERGPEIVRFDKSGFVTPNDVMNDLSSDVMKDISKNVSTQAAQLATAKNKMIAGDGANAQNVFETAKTINLNPMVNVSPIVNLSPRVNVSVSPSIDLSPMGNLSPMIREKELIRERVESIRENNFVESIRENNYIRDYAEQAINFDPKQFEALDRKISNISNIINNNVNNTDHSDQRKIDNSRRVNVGNIYVGGTGGGGNGSSARQRSTDMVFSESQQAKKLIGKLQKLTR